MENQSLSLLFRVEKEIAELLLTKIQDAEITLERASQISSFVIRQLPEGLSDEQVARIIPTLDDEFVELAEVVNKYLIGEEEKQKTVVLDKVRELSNQKQYVEASRLMTDYLNRKLK